jgi:hypothetical protein
MIEGAIVMIIETASADGLGLIDGSSAENSERLLDHYPFLRFSKEYVMTRSRTRTLAAVALLAALAVPWGAAGASAIPVTVMATCCSPNVN